MSGISPFERATPESQGVASPAIADFVEGVQAQHLGLHSLILLRHGRVVAEGWWHPFAPELPHVCYSLTKSFTSTAAGFAIAEGLLSLDDQVISFFPRAAPKSPSDNLRALRVRHLLGMTTGHEADPGDEVAKHPPREWMRVLFDVPLTHAPGTHFVYNSTASHLVSIIVQKLTGQKLVNYLRDRFFRPLGIDRPYWETDPLGHNWGGWGLFLRTDEIARFGQTLLQGGKWQGQQVIPGDWVAQATSKQVPNGKDPNSDWAQGYGFQFWMSRHGFRGDGAFGQFCVVLPEEDLFLVTTASTPDMQAVLNVAWQTLLPGLRPDSLPENPPAAASLRERLARLELDRPEGSAASPVGAQISGRHYSLESNGLGWKSVTVQLKDEPVVFVIFTAKGMHVIPAGVAPGATPWMTEKLSLDMPSALPAAASVTWTDERTLHATVCYLNDGATRTLMLRFEGDLVELRTVLTGTFAPPEEVTVAGLAVKKARSS